MTTKTKKIIYWAVIAALVLGMFLYLLLAKPGNVLMSIIYGIGGIVLGWIARILYSKYVKQ